MILLSSYNGERFVRDQLDSLLQQTHRNTRILIRDDGSTDGTRSILDSYAERHRNIEITYGDNLGYVKSFFWLLDHAPADAAYYCFCDQDDYWEADKVARGIRVLGGISRPAMVFTNVHIVDFRLRPLTIDSNRAPRGTAFENSLVQNIATGCTLMFNSAAAAVLRNRNVRHGELIYHDWWIYQVISAIGQVIYDPFPTVRYRQHDGNVVGQRAGWRAWLGRAKRQLHSSRRRLQRQAAELLRVHGGDFPPAKLRILEEFVQRTTSPSWLERSRYALRAPLYRQRALDDFIMRLLIAAGRV